MAWNPRDRERPGSPHPLLCLFALQAQGRNRTERRCLCIQPEGQRITRNGNKCLYRGTLWKPLANDTGKDTWMAIEWDGGILGEDDPFPPPQASDSPTVNILWNKYIFFFIKTLLIHGCSIEVIKSFLSNQQAEFPKIKFPSFPEKGKGRVGNEQRTCYPEGTEWSRLPLRGQILGTRLKMCPESGYSENRKSAQVGFHPSSPLSSKHHEGVWEAAAIGRKI